MDKKGVQLTLSVVVGAVILLLVAVVLIFVFIKGIDPFKWLVKSCEGKGGFCSSTPCSEQGAQSMDAFRKSCEETYGPGAYCCYNGEENPP